MAGLRCIVNTEFGQKPSVSLKKSANRLVSKSWSGESGVISGIGLNILGIFGFAINKKNFNNATTVWKHDMIFESDNPTGYSFNLGQTEKTNDPHKPLGPKATMLSSLAACSGLDVVSIAEKMKASFKDFKIEVEGELTDEHPKTYHTVIIDYHFYGSDLNEKKITKLQKQLTYLLRSIVALWKCFVNFLK